MSAARRVVLDTNVLSYLFRRSSLGEQYRGLLEMRVGCVACVTPEELYFGAEKRKWGYRKRAELESFITERIVLPATLEVARISGHLRAARERQGRPLERADAWIAATALRHGVPLITHDRDFDGIAGLQVITLNGRPFDEGQIPCAKTAGILDAALSCRCTC